MYPTQSILSLSLSLGEPRGVRVRLSLLMFVVIAAMIWRLGSVTLGLLAGAVLLSSVVIHQLAQIFVAQVNGIKITDVVLWPLGTLTGQASGAAPAVRARVQMIGPLVNLVIALICLLLLRHIGAQAEVFGYFSGTNLRLVPETDSLSVTVVQMIYSASLLLLCVNLLPIVPFDAGRVLQSFLSARYDSVDVNAVLLRLGLVFSLFGLMGGFIFDQSAIVALASFVIIIHLQEIGLNSAPAGYFRSGSEEDDHDGYSEMETEIEYFESFRSHSQDTDTDELIARSSMLDRKESERQRQQAADREDEEKQVDAILERIHRDGEKSLNPTELQLLRTVSQRYRKQTRPREHNTETGR
ncbi:MAG: hypothetical protein MK110_11235 [Fuerstiella sp.]|nr:hypothetical protein [Fuerstiella sp.]